MDKGETMKPSDIPENIGRFAVLSVNNQFRRKPKLLVCRILAVNLRNRSRAVVETPDFTTGNLRIRVMKNVNAASLTPFREWLQNRKGVL